MQNFETIVSQQNNQIKLLKKLNSKKHRDQENKFTVENLTIIYDALKSGYDFEKIFVTKEFFKKNKSKFEYIQNNSKSKSYYLIDEKINKYFSQFSTPPGLIAVYNIDSKTSQAKKENKGKEKEERNTNQPILYLNNISDPGNVGTILRTALAFNFTHIIVDDRCADVYNEKTISAAKDAIFKLNITKDKDNKWILDKNNKIPVYVTTPSKGTDLEKIKPAKSFCLVLGSESHGVDEKILAIAKKSIQIKISKNIESLNVASATAILLYKLSNIK